MGTETEEILKDLSETPCTSVNKTLTQDQRDRAEKNRQLALLRRRERAEEHDKNNKQRINDFGGFRLIVGEDAEEQSSVKKRKKVDGRESEVIDDMRDVCAKGSVVRIQGTKVVDTGGGFLIEESDLLEAEEEERNLPREVEPAPFCPPDVPFCDECGRPFEDSFLLKHFDHAVCDSCKDIDESHKLITKTDAKNEYLLKDVDFDRREPPLKFITRPNPHNSRWGDMKLFLQLQVEKRAIEIWGSLEKIEEELETREENRIKTKVKKFNKKMNNLRKTARSSLYTRDLSAHEHSWGPDICIDEEEDKYKHVCSECGQEEEFEKM